MSYEPTTWARGTKITASKLNNIEMGVQSVNSEYTPTTWAEGDIVTATKLNNIEQGIANASGGGGGGGDFSTAEVTIYNTGIEDAVVCRFPIIVDDQPEMSGTEVLANYNATNTYNVVLYKGAAQGYIQSENWDEDPICTGDITFSGSYFLITGNGTITFIG